ncbi:HNH endonuclease signature motif containing protein [Mycobacterium sp. 236(2023)]|uniref:HNH endonuclease signature motif containing protein n=1 Tax=Mycobacterium sp. 236(2023) TaxID=3038163 RepID=UPI002414D3C0|nr:HNH endonuclease signature motif containing protein [Mycobacterium sp. 236(2023)]MDG4666838.1 DUF222 domain-containing protein [Mycobacterium sp. 236(2023)]
MDAVSDALAGMGEQITILSKACDELSHRELIRLLSELATVTRTIPAVEHRVLARLLAETEPHRLGEASWKKVLTTALRISGREAGRRLVRAKTLGPRRAISGEPMPPLWEATAAAQAQGLLDEEHVAVIAKVHRALPTWVDAGTRAQADVELARQGAGLDPENLAAAARYLLVKIDQDGPEPSDKERIRRRGLRFGRQQADGYSRVSGWMTAKCRAMVEAVWAKEAAPGHNIPVEELDGAVGVDATAEDAVDDQPPVPDTAEDEAGGAETTDPATDGDPVTDDHDPSPQPLGADPRTQEQRNHDAFEALACRALEGGLGDHNGLPVTVIVSTTLQELEKGAGVAVTGGGSLVPMRDLIQMAANAFHYLYVYDQHTEQSLYLGRAKRLANPAQRIVLHGKERGCTRPGCTVSGYWAQVHHAVADWKDDGQTNIDELTFACGPDHRMLDKTGWRTRKNATGHTEWLPPPDLDTGQHRVNGYHHPERYLLPEDDEGP